VGRDKGDVEKDEEGPDARECPWTKDGLAHEKALTPEPVNVGAKQRRVGYCSNLAWVDFTVKRRRLTNPCSG